MVYFKVDANSKIGSGHLNRCRIISKELERRSISYCFLFSSTPANVIDGINLSSDQYETVDADGDFLQNVSKNSFLVIDSDAIQFSRPLFYDKCKAKNIKTMVMTVNDEPVYHCDLLLNQNILAFGQDYKTASFAKTLLGPEYFILQDKFRVENIPSKESRKEGNSVLVCFGGADPSNITGLILESLEGLEDIVTRAVVVVGGLNPHVEELKKQVAALNSKMEIELLVNVRNMESLMETVDFGIVSCGLTFWEMAVLQVPAFCLAASEREKESAIYLDSENYTQYLGSFDQPPVVGDMVEKIQHTVRNGIENTIFVTKLNHQINVNGVEKVVDEVVNLLESN